MFSIYNLYKNKLLMDYTHVKTIPNKNNIDMLIFIKDIIKKNIYIRFPKNNCLELNDLIDSITKIGEIKGLLNNVFNKGYNMLYNLIDYITSNKFFITQTPNCQALIVAQFIVINQIFGDGNHRTVLYILKNYSKYTDEDIVYILKITDKIHLWNGTLKYLWIGEEKKKEPDFIQLYNYKKISLLLKK